GEGRDAGTRAVQGLHGVPRRGQEPLRPARPHTGLVRVERPPGDRDAPVTGPRPPSNGPLVSCRRTDRTLRDDGRLAAAGSQGARSPRLTCNPLAVSSSRTI